MGFFEQVFGTDLGLPARAVVALVLVLALIALTVWLMRRFGDTRMMTMGGGRNRQQRLQVLDTAVVDARRRLVLIRRDNVEHLILIGGPSDVVVEPGIVRAASAAAFARATRTGYEAPEPEEVSLIPEPMVLDPEPEPEPAPAPAKPEAAKPEPKFEPRYETKFESKPEPKPEPKSEPKSEPKIEPAKPAAAALTPQPAPAPQAAPATVAAKPAEAPKPAPAMQAMPRPANKVEPIYAEMAQRLEAALRKPQAATPTPEPEVAARLATPAPRPTPTIVQAVPQPPAPRPQPALRAEPRMEARAEPRLDVRPEPRPETRTSASAPDESFTEAFSSLEQEMASLLRPGGKATQ